MIRIATLFAAATLAAGCAAPRAPLSPASPASPDAAEGARIARQSSLRPDETTRKSRALLSAAQKEQAQWDEFGPVSGTPDASKTEGKMKGMKHDH